MSRLLTTVCKTVAISIQTCSNGSFGGAENPGSFRDAADELVSVQEYKSDVRKRLINDGYRIWGIVGYQYSSITGLPTAARTFKLPNPMYYVA